MFSDVQRVSVHELKVLSASICMPVSKRTTLRNYYTGNFNIVKYIQEHYISYSGAD